MLAVVVPPLKFAPPKSRTLSASAFAHAGSAAPAARAGGLAALRAVTVSCADAWDANAAPAKASTDSDDDRFTMVCAPPRSLALFVAIGFCALWDWPIRSIRSFGELSLIWINSAA